jgi:hypothetical protein
MPETRQGLNCTLTFSRNGNTYGYRLRALGVSHGFSMLAEESQARTRKAYYPHRLAPNPFGLLVATKGAAEYNHLNSWLATYAAWILDPGLTTTADIFMAVSVPSRNFTRKGIVTQGIEFGDHVGSMLFQQMLMFVSLQDPADPDAYSPSKFTLNVSADVAKDVQYFYPSGTQLSGEDTPPSGSYTTVQYASDTSPVTAPIGGN